MPHQNSLLSIIILLFFSISLFSSCVESPEKDSEIVSMDEARTDSLITHKVDRYLSAMEALGFSGAIIVSQGDEVILEKGYGWANREERRPYTAQTVQSHGSITKQMTAAAILLLENKGQISVQDSIATYFKEVPEDKKGITIHHLLTHSSGLPGGIGPDEEPIEKKPYIQKAMEQPLSFTPGTEYAYSNTGYALLGILIEKVSGMGYEEFLRKELLLPAGMDKTGYVLPDYHPDSLAMGYLKGKKWGKVYQNHWLEDGPGWHLRANGGLHTTVGDMHLWYTHTLRNAKVLDSASVDQWTTPHITESNGVTEYAYGWVVHDSDWGKMISHSGSNRIFAADFVYLPEKDFFFYIHGNNSMMTAYDLRNSILKAAFDSSFQMPPLVQADDSISPESTAAREGDYQLNGGSISLKADDTRLIAKLSGQEVLNMLYQPSAQQKKEFEDLNRRTMEAMKNLEEGKEDAVAGLITEEEDAMERTAPFLQRIEQIGNLEELHVIGTFENAPGSRLERYGPLTTFVYAEFEYWNQYWNLVWNVDGSLRDNYSGPWPTFILVPTGDDQYTAVQEGPPWNTVEVTFEGDCLLVREELACKE